MPKQNASAQKQNEKRKNQQKAPAASPKKNTTTKARSRTQKKNKRPTLADVARLAGVSVSAVSFTLAGRLDIPLAEDTRERIKQCAKKLGYVPNRLGAGFFHSRSKLIGVLIVADSYRPFLACIAGIHEALAQADCFPLLMSSDWMEGYRSSCFAEGKEHDELADLHRLLEYQVDGIIYFSLSTHLTHAAACAKELARHKIPMVILGGVDPSSGNIDTVGGDNEKSGRMVADHLLSVGCSSFIFVNPIHSHPLDAAIHASFTARLKQAGDTCAEFALDPENPGDLGGLLSRLAKPPVGIFCTRDDVAALVMQTGFTLGWRVPHDAAIVTMGQSQIALPRFCTPPLTTVERNSYQGGKTAVELLLKRIEGFSEKPQCILIPPSLEVRASSVSNVPWQLYSPPLPQASPRPRSKKRG